MYVPEKVVVYHYGEGIVEWMPGEGTWIATATEIWNSRVKSISSTRVRVRV